MFTQRLTSIILSTIALLLVNLQLSVSVPVRMEGPAQLLTLVPVMWGGQECSVIMVSEKLISQ